MSDNLPDRMLTLAEVAKILGLGRTTLYDMAHEYERTNERSGLPVRRIRGQLRVPPKEFAEKFGLTI